MPTQDFGLGLGLTLILVWIISAGLTVLLTPVSFQLDPTIAFGVSLIDHSMQPAQHLLQTLPQLGIIQSLDQFGG
jgi:hypothetical protein